MKFPYKAFPRNPSEAFPDRTSELIPYLPITLSYAGKSFDTVALADSGASHCLFPGMLGVGLGIDVEKGAKQKIYGLGRGQVIVHFHEINLKLADCEWTARVGFTMNDLGTTGLLGQSGFFINFRVIFDRMENCVIVNKRTLLQRALTGLGL